MASLEAVRNALGQTINNYVSGELFVYGHVEEFGEVPAVIIEPDVADFQGAFARGLDEWIFNVYVLCSTKADSAYGQGLLDRLVSGSGPDSIRQVLHDHADLGLQDGTDATVIGMKGYGGKFEWSKVGHVGAILKVLVRTDGRA